MMSEYDVSEISIILASSHGIRGSDSQAADKLILTCY